MLAVTRWAEQALIDLLDQCLEAGDLPGFWEVFDGSSIEFASPDPAKLVSCIGMNMKLSLETGSDIVTTLTTASAIYAADLRWQEALICLDLADHLAEDHEPVKAAFYLLADIAIRTGMKNSAADEAAERASQTPYPSIEDALAITDDETADHDLDLFMPNREAILTALACYERLDDAKRLTELVDVLLPFCGRLWLYGDFIANLYSVGATAKLIELGDRWAKFDCEDKAIDAYVRAGDVGRLRQLAKVSMHNGEIDDALICLNAIIGLDAQ